MISVIIPCYNCQDFIQRSVNSVLNQVYKNYEIILVDNNSNDETFKILAALKSGHPDFIKIFTENQPGAPAARNKGLLEAKGDYIQFLDADDELKPNKLQVQHELIENNKADVIIGSRILQYIINGQIKQHIRHPESDIWKGLINSNLGITSSNLWRKDTVTKAGCWDTTLTSSQEYNLLFNLLKIKAVFKIDLSVQTIIHKTNSTISKNTDNKKLQQIIFNRIQLRMCIIAYLREQQLLTPLLSREADKYIYKELMANFSRIPRFASFYLRKNKLQVSNLLRLKQRLKLMKNNYFN